MGKKIENYRDLPAFEQKKLPTFVKSVDDDRGIVEHFVAILGNRDRGGDRIMPGAFTKSISERGLRVKVLDAHSTDSVTRIVGKPLSLKEVGRSELTPEVLEYAPDATGGLLAMTQYAIETSRGKDVFQLVKGNYAPESSIGYDPVQVEFAEEKDADGDTVNTRLLKEIRLWEYSNVVFGMNTATSVVSAKQAEVGDPDDAEPASDDGKQAEAEPAETAILCECLDCQKQMEIESGEHCADLKCPECGGEMRRADRPGPGKADAEPDEGKPAPEETEKYIHIRVQDPSDFDDDSFRTINIGPDNNGIQAVIGRLKEGGGMRVQKYIFDKEQWTLARAQEWVDEHKKDLPPDTEDKAVNLMQRVSDIGQAPSTEQKAGRVIAARNERRIVNALTAIIEVLEDAGIDIPGWERQPQMPDEEGKSAPAPDGQAATDNDQQESPDEQAGPVGEPPTSVDEDKLARELELLELELQLMEV